MWQLFAVATALKVLLIPTYHSTDFEVHRNWLAITHSLPVSKWYYEDTSIWTLDYPPFFAWFEYALSHVAPYFDPAMLQVPNLSYDSPKTVLFQRMSVMATDLFLLYATNQASQAIPGPRKDLRRLVFGVLVLMNCGLFIVDHIHFQYNGMLMGLLLLSMIRIRQGRELEGGILFAVLMNFKHLFLSFAPAYFVYLLSAYCFDQKTKGFLFGRFVALGVSVVAVFALSFGPFVAGGHLAQVLSRLFPFKRGLVHAYWAPNFWALYTATDKLLATLQGVGSGGAVMTGGIVGEATHLVLPQVTPFATLLITLISMLPAMWVLWRRGAGGRSFEWGSVMCGFSMYMFGWHVHEKAIITVLIPLCLLAVEDAFYAKLFVLLSLPGHYSLFPLLYEPKETPIKVMLLLLYTIFAAYGLPAVSGYYPENKLFAFFERLYAYGFILLQVYVSLIHQYIFGNRMEFLPLLLTSVYCAAGVVFAYVRLYLAPPPVNPIAKKFD
eukprot:comp11442_c0_seq1/m.5858 comp11442_c0_seq1/g.5858  ORF comp11442_c0_seq1/g.5858 comp11442_c0_seq1/m.5858 type:complete len:495 (-) comp11442_c0_seq1:360-1844(-)